jgi:hypothetical protein
MRLLLAEIRSTNRPIVTNFPIITKNLGAALHKEYGETYDILHRITYIEARNEVANFYRIRSQATVREKDWLVAEKDSKGKSIGYDIQAAFSGGGVFYLLDEVHLVFGARDWQEMGRACIYYASQHRKLGDDVILVSQVPKNVDNQFRGLAQDFSVLRNHGMERIWGFKQPDVFTRKTYQNMPTGSQQDTPMETSRFKLNLLWANCYESERGMGITNIEGGKADKGVDRRKGVRWYWGVLALLLVVALVVAAVVIVPSMGVEAFVGSIIGGDSNQTETEDGNQTRVMPTSVAEFRNAVKKARADKTEVSQGNLLNTNLTELNADSDPPETINVPPMSTNQVEGYLIARFRGKNQARFRLSNGAVLSTGTSSIREVRATGIVDRNGRFIRFNPRIRFDLRTLYGTPED